MLPRKASAGFTLIEVLIAMTLLGIMVVLLFSSMKICADSWQKGEDKITEVNDVAVVYQFFQHHLSAAFPLWDDFSDQNNKAFSFQGKSQELQFVSAFPASAKKSGLQLFSLKLINDGDEQLIQVSIIPFFPVARGEEWRNEEVILLRHVRKFSLSYFGSDDPQAEAYWQDDWLEKQAQPRLVKIKIERDDDSFWPEIIVELKSAAPSNNFDGQTLGNDNNPDDENNNEL
ncbi:MAG: prepilin-type N-terminal cleavage/methylation domain-containing protein [Methyloglobulus sp.]|nr:prepilin-type N-terminal cleavage/methylation domain-containing protein [Methyloglobulus sp.]